jgi:Rnl2 family RNA ligase
MLKYPSIENSYREKFIQFIRETEAANDTWWAFEKAHGSNMVMIYDGKKISYGKRGGLIPEGENFFNHLQVMPEYADSLVDLYHGVLKLDNQVVTVYGEIFGQGIQKGVNYGPKQFRFFDITVDGRFVDQDRLFDFEFGKLRVLPFIGKGTFDEVLAMNCEFDSLILKIPNNTAEGFVMKPNKTLFLTDTDTRVILKKKSEKFKETEKNTEKVVQQRPGVDILLQGYMTEQRIQSAISKFGPDFKNFSLIKAEFIRDVLEECEKDTGKTFDPKSLEKEASDMVRTSLRVLV